MKTLFLMVLTAGLAVGGTLFCLSQGYIVLPSQGGSVDADQAENTSVRGSAKAAESQDEGITLRLPRDPLVLVDKVVEVVDSVRNGKSDQGDDSEEAANGQQGAESPAMPTDAGPATGGVGTATGTASSDQIVEKSGSQVPDLKPVDRYKKLNQDISRVSDALDRFNRKLVEQIQESAQ